jgi:hypothetical protein
MRKYYRLLINEFGDDPNKLINNLIKFMTQFVEERDEKYEITTSSIFYLTGRIIFL